MDDERVPSIRPHWPADIAFISGIHPFHRRLGFIAFTPTYTAPLDSKHLPYPKASAHAGLAPPQRHIPWSIATVRFRLARAIARIFRNAHVAEYRVRG